MTTLRDPKGAISLRLLAAVFVPALVWYAEQQGVTALTKFACRAAGPPLTPLAGLIGIAACLGCAALAWPARRERPFMAWLGLGSAGAFALVLVFQTLAATLLPPCAR